MVRRLSLLLSAVLLGGCQGHDPVRSEKALDAAPLCCRDYSAMPFAALELNARLTIDLNAESPVFQFSDGQRGYFRAFRLPPWQGPLQITLYSSPVAGAANTTGVIRPAALFLDGNFRETRYLVADPERHWQPNGFMFTVFVNESNRGECYFVVHAERSGADKARFERAYTPTQVGTGVLVVPMTFGGETRSVSHQFAAEGPLQVVMKPYGTRTVGSAPARGNAAPPSPWPTTPSLNHGELGSKGP